jgi:hypothetical protein
MGELYNPMIALHYAAYRPPLHEVILRYVLSDKEHFAERGG